MPEQAASTNSSSGPDPLACYIVGTQYGSGSPEANVEKNYVEALKYFNRCMAITSSRINIDFSALDGTIPKSMLRPHPPHGQDERHFCGSAFQAGLMYLYGSSPEGERVHSVTSVEADPALAIRYWKEAGVLGHAQACYNLGIVYANGMGVEADRVEAGKWFGRAGKLDSTGKLVAPNGIQVLEWDASVNAVPGVQPKKRVHRKRRSRKTKDQGGLPVLWMIGSALAVSGVAWWYYTRHSK
ncbi:hypothetical protein BDF14DRAFT_1758534 [Spinellus fusiger]|nr:hypothetical protein BDF14DRAFT_1758534 [Spinellus fusiger]